MEIMEIRSSGNIRKADALGTRETALTRHDLVGIEYGEREKRRGVLRHGAFGLKGLLGGLHCL